MARLSGGSEWALVLSPEPPFPIAGGGAMRSASLCRFLAERYRLHLVTFTTSAGTENTLPADLADRLHCVRLPSHGKSLAARAIRNTSRLLRGALPLSDRFSNAQARQQVAGAIAGRQYRLALVEHFWCACYEQMLRPQAAYVMMDMHNIESALHARCAETDGWPARWAHRAFAGMARAQEQQMLPRFDLVLAASEPDQERIRQLAPGARVTVYPNAIPLCFPAAVEEEHCIAFSGNLEYHPNVAAVRFFAGQVWPVLREQDPSLRWRLIGKNEWAVRRWTAADPRIETTGAVEDAVAELARVRVVVVPLLAGSGTRIKILEAWPAGRAVVSTRVGAEGLPALDGGNLLLADSADEIRDAVLGLLRDPDRRRRLGCAGRRLVEEQLCWPVVWRRLEQDLAAHWAERTAP